MTSEEPRRCIRCSMEKTLSEFCTNRTRKDGIGAVCKSCKVAISIAWAKDNPDRYTKTQTAAKLRRATVDPETGVTPRRQYRLSKYGLTVTDYANLLDEQQNRCAICQTDDPKGRSGTWLVDHDHDTGLPRGLLCNCCNLGLGKLKDSPTVLASSLRYLHRHGKALSTSEVLDLFDALQLQPNAEVHSDNPDSGLRDGQPAPCDDSPVDAPAG